MGELNRDKTEKTVSKGIHIQLDKPRRLLLDDQALRLFEFDGGELKTFTSGKATLWDLVHLLRACLAHEDDNLTIEETMRIINQQNMQTVFVQLIRLIRDVVKQVNTIIKSEVKHGRR